MELPPFLGHASSSSLCAICSQQVGCHAYLIFKIMTIQQLSCHTNHSWKTCCQCISPTLPSWCCFSSYFSSPLSTALVMLRATAFLRGTFLLSSLLPLKNTARWGIQHWGIIRGTLRGFSTLRSTVILMIKPPGDWWYWSSFCRVDILCCCRKFICE